MERRVVRQGSGVGTRDSYTGRGGRLGVGGQDVTDLFPGHRRTPDLTGNEGPGAPTDGKTPGPRLVGRRGAGVPSAHL